MSWATAVRKHAVETPPSPTYTAGFATEKVDWARLVSVDFETFYDEEYTLSKLSTSEYIRDPRFEALMMGVKVGTKKRVVIPGPKIKSFLSTIPWSTHTLLCHNNQFDGLILSHHYGVVPLKYYCTLSMARGLHSNEIGAGLDEVAQFYGLAGKLKGNLEKMKGRRYKQLVSERLYDQGADYCGVDVDIMHEIFKLMLPSLPRDEIDLIDLTMRMFCDPVLHVDVPRVQQELERELAYREKLLLDVVPPDYAEAPEELPLLKTVLKSTAERALTGKERLLLKARRLVGSNEKFADLLRAEGAEPPVKISPAWTKKSREEREASPEGKWAYAFAKDDAAFNNLPDDVELISHGLDMNKTSNIKLVAARQERLRALVDVRLAVKSTTNVTRAERFITAGTTGKLPVGYAYYRAHTGRWGGNNKMNMQNLTRGGELRLSILAAPGHVICTVDSGQIEARVNAWLWDQTDLLDAFRAADTWDKSKGVARGKDRDAYCKFADAVYGREITTDDKTERFVGKVCLAGDTRVFTNHGLKSIVEVRSTDLLWDGESWVTHGGLLDQGIREVHRAFGLAATPDHEILTERGWREWQEVHTDPTLTLSALSSANLRSCVTSTTSHVTENLGATGPSAAVLAARKTWSMLPASKMVDQPVAIAALNEQQAQSGTGSTRTPCPKKRTVRDFLTGCHQRLVVAVTPATHRISTTANEVSQYIQSGLRTALRSFGMSGLSTDGTRQSLSSTEWTTTTATDQAMYVSQARPSTQATSAALKTLSNAFVISKQRTRTFDLANAGPNHRFMVMTDIGPVIVHNCVLGLGYQMGAAKLQITLAKGALGGEPVYFSDNECRAIINTYRRQNGRIKAGWEKCTKIIEDMAAGRSGSWKCISWEKDTIWLPNGMCLKYPNLKLGKNDETDYDEWTYQSGDQRKKIYGGLLCENLVQALARIIVGCQMLTISRKYRVVMTTHDEVSTHVKAKLGPTAFAYMQKVMKTPLDWCPDIPLNCEGGFDINYSK